MSKKRILINLVIIVLSGIVAIGLDQILNLDSTVFVIGAPVLITCILFGSVAFKKD